MEGRLIHLRTQPTYLASTISLFLTWVKPIKHALIDYMFLCFIPAKVNGEIFFVKYPGLCKAIACLCTISCVTSLMTIAMMSLNRYFYICHNEIYEKIFTKRNCVCICISLYSVGCILILMNALGIGDHSFDPKSLECIWDRMATYYYTVVFSIALVWIPSVTIGLFYVRIFMFVRHHRLKMEAQAKGKEGKTTGTVKSAQLAKTLFVIYAVFVTCWAPYALLIVLDSQNTFSHEVHVYVTMFAHLHPSINWIIYYTTNKNFTVAYQQMFRKFGCCGKSSNAVHDETMAGSMAKRDPSTVTSVVRNQEPNAWFKALWSGTKKNIHKPAIWQNRMLTRVEQLVCHIESIINIVLIQTFFPCDCCLKGISLSTILSDTI